MKLKDIKPAEYNPRIITDDQLARLKKSLAEFGDLSGIIFNRRTGNLLGGHQRLKVLPQDAKIEKTKLKKPSRTGTVAEGRIIIDGENFVYREVDWPLEKEKAANIAANQHGGEWDDEALAKILKELSDIPEFDTDLLGFDSSEIDAILSSIENEGLTAPDEVPEVPAEPITKLGDLSGIKNNPLTVRASSLYSEDVQITRAGSGLRSDAERGVLVLGAVQRAECLHVVRHGAALVSRNNARRFYFAPTVQITRRLTMTEQEFREYCLGLADYLSRMIPQSNIDSFLRSNQEIKTNKDKQIVAFAMGIDLFLKGCRYSNGWQAQESQPSAKVIHFPINLHKKRKREQIKTMCKDAYDY